MSKWYWYTRGTIHPHRADLVLLGIKYFAPKLNVSKFYKTLYINIGDKLYWGWDDKEIRNLGKKILAVCSTSRGQRKHIDRVKFYIRQALQAANKIKSLNLKQYSNQELINLYDYLLIKAAPAHGFLDADVDAIDVVSEDFLAKIIKRNLPKSFSQVDFVQLYQNLATPIYESYLAKEERDIIKLASKHYQTRDIRKLYQKHWWVTLGWESMKIRSTGYYVAALKKFKNKKAVRVELFKLDNRPKRIKIKRTKLLKRYKLGKEVFYWLKFFDVYTYLHDYRKEMQMKTAYSFYLLLKEVGRRFKLNPDDLEWLYYEDMKKLLHIGKIDKQEVKQRKKAAYVLVDKSGIRRFSGSRALSLAHKVLDLEPIKTKIITGTPVSSGKLIARVKVCSGSEEANRKVKKGEVLVCGMTMPDYVPAMKKSSAIITDEGGITCHAAIIARELGKPCIVGTKIATKALKDGDRVEVDADKGIIQIIN
ncbi:MAG: PEP-utilizing enzyme [Patescibacteria group bacterium]